MSVRILIVLIFCLTGILKAQNNLTIISENGEPFWLYLNEHKVNDSAQAIVTATEVKKDTCSVRITYQNNRVPTVGDKVYLLQRGKACKNLSFRYAIGTIKGKTALKYISTDDLATDTSIGKEKPSEHIKGVFTSVKKQEDTKNRLAEKYPLPSQCNKTISDSIVVKQLIVLKNNHIEINRIKDAKWFISNNCLSVAQTQKVFTAFDYEDSKLQLAEFAYNYLYDKSNFMQLLKSLQHITDQKKLEDFYNTRKLP